MRKNEINWAIFSGKCLLPFTIRSTKNQCIREYLRDRIFRNKNGIRLLKSESCKKVVINEWKPK